MADYTGIKVVFGSVPNQKFRIYGRSGRDITDEFPVCKVEVTASCHDVTKIVLTAFGEVDAEADTVDVDIKPTDSAFDR